jgi:hypothetical protein
LIVVGRGSREHAAARYEVLAGAGSGESPHQSFGQMLFKSRGAPNIAIGNESQHRWGVVLAFALDRPPEQERHSGITGVFGVFKQVSDNWK